MPEDEREQFLGQLQASLDKLMGIVDEIITIAELERGTFALDVTPMDLAPLIRHAVDEVSREYPHTPIVAAVPDELQAVADGPRVGGVVRELLDNACRYSPAGAGWSSPPGCSTKGSSSSVTDHGDGLDRSIAMKAFEQPFSTGEATLRKEKAGVGVGLHLARQIVWRARRRDVVRPVARRRHTDLVLHPDQRGRAPGGSTGRRRLNVLNGRSSIGALAGVSSDRRFTPGSIVRPARRTRARRHQLQRGSVDGGHGTPHQRQRPPVHPDLGLRGLGGDTR